MWWLARSRTQSVHVRLFVHIFMHILFIAYMHAFVRPYLLNALRLPIARHHPEGSVAGLSEVIKGWFF
jgi:hypothetical protein